MEKYYNFETHFRSLADDLSIFLKTQKIYYERSGGVGFYHFEILTDNDGANMINNWLDNNSIVQA